MTVGDNVGDYMCGLIRFTSDAVLDCATFDKGDRGWFRRVHDFCNEIDCKNHPRKIGKLVGYDGVMIFALVCGIGWILSGLIAFAGSLKPDKLLAITAGILFTLLYLAFIGIFTVVWISVKRVRKNCRFHDKSCNKYMKRTRRSSNEFLAYSICAFVLIIGAIICCFFSMTLITDDEKADQEIPKKKAINEYDEENQKSAGRMEDNQSVGSMDGMPERQPRPEHEKVSNYPVLVEESKRYTGAEFKQKFQLLHRYISNKKDMQDYVNKKFDEVDTNKSGSISTSELKDFVTSIMKSQGLPPPTDKKVNELMKYFDLDRSETLEKHEFEKMLDQVFMESREILVRRYAEKKANSWKPMKIPEDKDTSKLSTLDNLLGEREKLYKTIDNIANKKGYNRKSNMDINKLTELIKETSDEFRVPALSRSDIEEVMDDIEKPISSFDKADQNLATLLALSIARSLMD